MSEFIEIHVCPKGEAMIIRKSVIGSLWASPNGGSFINLKGRTGPLQVSDSYEDLRAALLELKEGEV